MKDLLLNIEGLSLENLTTKILQIILTYSGFEVYQKLFYNYIFNNSKNKSTEEYLFEISSQERYGQDQPDLIISSAGNVFIIENKFYANFSGNDQITRYRKLLLEEFKNATEKTIFLLTLKRQEKYYKDLLKTELKENYDKDVRIKFIFWDEIIELFKSNHFLIEALDGYLRTYYLTEVKFSKQEFEMLNSKLIPETLDKLFQTIDLIKGEFVNYNFEIVPYKSSQKYHGFYLRKENLKVWFGSALDWWGELDDNPTPLFMQIRDEWNPTIAFEEKLNDFLMKMNFKYHKGIQWIKPYPASLLEVDKSELVTKISDDISIVIKNITLKNVDS